MRHAVLALLLTATAIAAPGPGDACLICDGKPGTATREVIVNGRRVSLCDHPSCEAAVRRDPERLLKGQSPQSALFHEEMDYDRRPAWTAFGAGLIALGGVLAIAAVAHWRLGGGAELTRIPSTPVPLSCPACGAENHPAAPACATCHAALAPRADREVDRA